MKKIYCLLYSLFLLLNSSFAQNPLVKQWDKRFGGTKGDSLTIFHQTRDGGYILGGYSASVIGGDKTQVSKGVIDYWIVKIDSLGIKQWDKDFGGTGDDELYELQQTTDGGYILGGLSNSGIGGDKTQPLKGSYDYWIVKIDSLGNKQWDKDFGGTGDDELFSLQQTTDGGYILGGSSGSGIGGNKTQASQGYYDYWIVKIDSLGNEQWDKDFGGTDDDELYSLQQTRDGGFILGGYSAFGIGGTKNQALKGNSDYWIIKIDAVGKEQWEKDFGGPSYNDFFSLQQTSEGGYILGGLSSSGIGADKTQALKGFSDYWIVKIDSLGNKKWDKDFGGTLSQHMFGNISQTADGGYLMAGTSYSNISGDKTENNLGSEQTWVIKTDSLGTKQWDKTVQTTDQDKTGFTIQAKDGGYVIANCTLAGSGGDKTQPSLRGLSDYWIIKFRDTTNVSIVPPQSAFLAADTVLCTNDCISFTNLSSNATAYQWYFPGATISSDTAANPPNVCYKTAGSYDVTLIAYNAGGSDSITFSNYIHVKPAPQTPVITSTGTTLYCSTDPSYATYQWYDSATLITGATDTLLVITHSGNYNVQVSNQYGCKTEVSIYAVISPPLTNFLAADTALCANDCSSFTNSSSNATSYQWYFAGGTPSSSTMQNPYVCYKAAGSYDVKLIAYNAGGSDSLTISNYIHVHSAPPIPVITSTGTTLYCSTDPSYTSYQWYDNATLISGATDTLLVITHSGTYNVQVSNQYGCKTEVGVNAVISPPLTNFLAADTVLCANDCISFTNSSSNATAYEWYFAGGTPSSSTSASPVNVCYKTAGSYDVKLIGYNAGGSDSLTISNYIHVKAAPPIPLITPVGTILYCSTDPSYVAYQWYDDTTLIPGAVDTVIEIYHSGNYAVQVSNSYSCKIASGINVVITNTVPLLTNDAFFIFPNPLTSSAILQFNKQLTDAEVVIYDILGKEVMRRKINGNRMELEKETLMSGVYFVSVRDKEKRYIQRIIVE